MPAMKVSTRAALAILLAIVVVECSSPSKPTPPTGPFTIAGRVTDFGTGNGVSALQIRVGTEEAVTDAGGNYTVLLDRGDYQVRLPPSDTYLGLIVVGGPWTRGDVYVNGGVCAVRYGAVTDHNTGKPIFGATIGAGPTTTDATGLYRVDYYGCSGSCGACNTSILQVKAIGYKDFSQVLGRGVAGVQRLDIHLDPL
jgi:hypothetical protein